MQRYNFDNIRVDSPLIMRGFKLETQTLTLVAGNNRIDKNFAPIVLLDANGADRTVLLPLETNCRGLTLALMNVTSTPNFTITLKSNNGVTTLGQMLSGATLDLNKHLMFTCDGSRWWPIGNNGGVFTVNGIVANIDMKFQQNVLFTNGVASDLSSILATTRAGTATYTDATGTVTDVAANLPRIGNLGLLVEAAATNSARNGMMTSGVVSGSPGTLPTNVTIASVPTGLTRTISQGTESNGLPYVDLNFAGTCGSTAAFQIAIESNNQIAATVGQAWTQSLYFKVQQDDPALSSILMECWEYDAVPTFLATGGNKDIYSSRLTYQRQFQTATLAQATTAFVSPRLRTNSINSGTVINITFRLAGWQVEQSSMVSSLIKTTAGAVTRAADLITISGAPFTSWWNGTLGTIYAEASFNSSVAPTHQSFFQIDDATALNRIWGTRLVGTNNYGIRYGVAGVFTNPADIVGAITPGGVDKIAFGYDVAGNAESSTIDANTVTTSASGGSLAICNRMLVGQSSSGERMNGYVRRFAWFNTKLSDPNLLLATAA